MAKSNSTSLANKLEARAASKPTGVTIYDLIEKQKPAIERALPNVGLSAERLTRVLHTQLRLNPKLASCTPASLLGAVMLTAQLGLEPGPLGQAYFVPFGTECQFIIGYKGLISLAYRSGGITISAYEICTNDLFEHDYGTGQVKHSFRLQKERGPIIGFWAKAVLPNGQQTILVMTANEVDQHRDRSRASNSGPWQTDYPAMGRKTVIRALCSQLPLNAEAQRAIAADETAVVFSEEEGIIDLGDSPAIVDVETIQEDSEVTE